MNNFRFVFFIFSFLWSIATANAGVWITTQQVYSCLGYDGVPITGQPLEGQCCDGSGNLKANAPSDCSSGFNSILTDAVTGAGINLTIAQKSLEASNGMNGETTNFNNVSVSTTGTPGPGSTLETSASTAGTSITPTLGSTTNDPSFGANSFAGSGSGSGGGAGRGSGTGAKLGGLDSSFSSGRGGGGLDGDASNQGMSLASIADENSAKGRAYSGSGGNGSASGSFGGKFGNGSGARIDGKDFADKNFDLSGADKNVGDGKNKELDEDAGATTDDPTDYFGKIDPSANLFKVVSNRYLKKKSLWKVK